MKIHFLLPVFLLSIFSFNINAGNFNKSNVPNYDKLNNYTYLNEYNSVSNSENNLATSVPTTNPTVSSPYICEGSTLNLTANPSGGTAPYTFSWTGPNGYVSTNENPVITNVNLTHAGVYSLVITDNIGATSTIQSTAIVTVNSKIDPTFDATLPAICKGGIAPLLTTTSTNGITGTWSPSTVSNTATGTYIFTPNAGQCANSFSLTVFVVNNVTPTFTLPASICQGDTPPLLSTISNNGIVGTWSPSVVSNLTSGSYTFSPSIGQCATSKTINININQSIAVFLPAIPPICSGDTLASLPTTSSNGVTGTWSPPINNTATTTYTFTPTAGQCATVTTSMTIVVNPNITPTFNAIPAICTNATAPILPSSSTNGFTGTWNPTTVSNTTSGIYTFTPNAGQCATMASVSVTVSPNITPTFDAIPAICANATAPVLPSSSNNGFTGTWNPTTVSNTTTGTYIFTPDLGQCATTASVSVTVSPNITPIFDAIPAICANTTAPVLPSSSNNGFTGTWNPKTVSNTASGTYIFTPDSGQCATTASVTVTVSPNITPTFDAIPAICTNATAPILPSSSTNSFTGTWNPITVSNTASGTYTFTPDSGQCATTASVSVTVSPNITPTFNAIPAICANATAPILPSSSNNGFIGTWNPTTVSNTSSGTYIFTPTAGQCATTASVSVTVSPNILPTFDAIPAICANTTAPVLPSSSNNGFTGTWNPATVSNITTGTYIFTPSAGQCATTASVNVTVIPNVIPTFDVIANVCYGTTAPSLPSTSINGITGTWNPAIVSNTTSGTYTFTPNPGPCATTSTLTINVTTITPSFDTIAPICANTTPPLLTSPSTNGISGSWNPATVSNTVPGTYVFTPDAGQCATTASLTITVNPIITPSFTTISQLCSGSTSPVLPLTSNNSITGTWNPATISNTISGTYTFTPTAGQCAIGTTLNVMVTPNTTPTFTAVAPICSGSTRPLLPTVSNNLITGTWSPAIVSNTVSGTYTFTPTFGQCGLTTTLSVIVYQSPTDIILKTTDVIHDEPNGIIEIMSITSGVAPYQYSFNSGSFTSETIYPNLIPGDYTITVIDSNGCEFNKKVTINSICIYPNAITPNNDSHNDTFDLRGCNITKLELFNRYGRKINSYNNYTNQWDGTTSGGEALPDGTYFYVAEIKGGSSKSGWVYITR